MNKSGYKYPPLPDPAMEQLDRAQKNPKNVGDAKGYKAIKVVDEKSDYSRKRDPVVERANKEKGRPWRVVYKRRDNFKTRILPEPAVAKGSGYDDPKGYKEVKS